MSQVKIFEEGDCLSEKQIAGYLNDRLSLLDRHRVEKHLLTCALCEEAMEGYALIAPEKQAGLMEGDEKGTWVNTSLTRRIAASVTAFLILAGGLLYLQNRLESPGNLPVGQKQESTHVLPADSLKETQDKDKKETSPLVEISSALSQPEEQHAKKKASVEKSVELSSAAPKASEIQAISAGQEKKAEEVQISSPSVNLYVDSTVLKSVEGNSPAEPAKVASADASEHKELAMQRAMVPAKKNKSMNSSPSGETHAAKESADNYYRSDMADNAIEHEESQLKTGIRYYDQKKFTKALSVFEAILSKEPANAEAVYYAGLTAFKLKSFDQALTYFDKIKKGMRFYEEARWEKARVFLERKDMVQATGLLKEIAEGKGPFAGQAVKKLGEIK